MKKIEGFTKGEWKCNGESLYSPETGERIIEAFVVDRDTNELGIRFTHMPDEELVLAAPDLYERVQVLEAGLEKLVEVGNVTDTKLREVYHAMEEGGRIAADKYFEEVIYNQTKALTAVKTLLSARAEDSSLLNEE